MGFFKSFARVVTAVATGGASEVVRAVGGKGGKQLAAGLEGVFAPGVAQLDAQAAVSQPGARLQLAQMGGGEMTTVPAPPVPFTPGFGGGTIAQGSFLPATRSMGKIGRAHV